MVSPESQIAFLTNLQRLLSEGSFVATYKYALLLALADISVENGDDAGSELEISTKEIAGKFLTYYWRQSTPFIPRATDVEQAILLQNTGRQAAIISRIADARFELGDSLGGAKAKAQPWNQLLRQVDQTVRVMPLWKLQTVGSQQFDFLYPSVGQGMTITLRPGIATCFRKFYALVSDILRGAWIRHVRRYNCELLGTTTDLTEFMFGSERAQLGTIRDVLLETGPSRCFYCDKDLPRQTSNVDHFVPWARYPVDLGHNFVLAHSNCNSSKSDHVASAEYLEKWVERNLTLRESLQAAFTASGISSDLPTSARVAKWIYSSTAGCGGLTWSAGVMKPLEEGWQSAIDRILVAA